MGKLIFCFFISFFSLPSLSLVPDNFFQNHIELIEGILLNKNIKQIKLRPNSYRSFDHIRMDPNRRISSSFRIPPFFSKSVSFWFNIYTQYPSSSVVIHDKENLGLVYGVMDFSYLSKSTVNYHTRMTLQSKLALKKIRYFKKALQNLSLNLPSPYKPQILASLKHAGIKVPPSRLNKRLFYRKLIRQIRAQTGQKNNIKQGLKNIRPYYSTLVNYFRIFKAPIELLAIPFLESSFNLRAKSKVGATGTWQFMKRIGRHFMPYNKWIDSRLNPFISTLSALHLLKENKRTLGRWDLAVPAYNSGTRHLLKAKRMTPKRKLSLQHILTHYKHPHLGFASRNFYSEFLALVYTLAYKERLFPDIIVPKNGPKVRAYLTKCPLVPNHFFKALAKYPLIQAFNTHIKKRYYRTSFKPGLILFSPVKLNEKKYYEVKGNNLKYKYPKNWSSYLKNHRCSIK